MEDVIFGGSDARKPTAAAEVRLKLSGVAARVPGQPQAGHGHGQRQRQRPCGLELGRCDGGTAGDAEGGGVAVAPT